MLFLRRFSISVVLFITSLTLYLSTLAPGMLRGDSGEFQWAMVSLNVAHATGYPLFTLIGQFWQALIPFGNIAWRLNLLSALFGALTIVVVYQFAFELTHRTLAALAGAIFLAVAPVFWFNASILEVYTLNTLFLVAILYLLWRWTQAFNFRLLCAAVFVLGLALAHHRMMILALPGIALYVVWNNRELLRKGRALAMLALSLVPGLALYLYVILRLVESGQTWQYAFNDIVLGREFQGSLLREFHLLDVFALIPLDNFSIGLVFALLGALVLFRRDIKLAALFTLTYVLDAIFVLIYSVPDQPVFLTPSFVIVALWIAIGVEWLIKQVSPSASLPRALAPALPGLLVLAALLLALFPFTRWNDIKVQVAAETDDVENNARALLASALPQGAWLELDWETATAVRFLQATERTRPDLDARLIHIDQAVEYHALLRELDRGTPVFLDPSVQIDRFVAGYQWTRGPDNLWMLNPVQESANLIGAKVNNNLQLAALSGDDKRTVLLWKVFHPLGDNYATYIHYFDADGNPLGQQDKGACCEPIYAYATGEWETNMLIADYYRALPPTTTYLRLGLYKKDANDDLVPYGATLYVQTQPLTLDGMQTRVDAPFGDEIILRGYTLARTGSQFGLQLFWESNHPTDTDYTVFVHALDAQSHIVAQVDRQPLNGLYPTHSWRSGLIVRETIELETASAVTKLRVGLYNAQNNARLVLADGQSDAVEIFVGR